MAGGKSGDGDLTCDGSPTKTQILQAHRRNARDANWSLCFGLRPPVELYDLKRDPDCLVNLAGRKETKSLETSLQRQLLKELRAQEDPRMFGKGSLFEAYPYSDEAYRNFYGRFMSGEKLVPLWVNDSDFEKRGSPP